MRLHRIEAVVLRHMYELRHNGNHLINMVYFPVVNIVMWGFLTIYLTNHQRLQLGLISSLLGGVVLWGLFYGFQRDMAQGFLEEVWTRNLVGLFSSPLSVAEYIYALVCVNLIKAFFGLALESVIALLCYHFNIFPLLIEFVPFIAVLMFFGFSIGVVITSLIVRYGSKLEGLAWSFAGILMPFSCVFYPLNTLPVFLHPLALALPTTHSFEGMRQLLAGGGFSISDFRSGITLDIAYLALAILLFRRMFESARSRGLLIKME
ncbi:ABC transporter permease [Mycobacterium cookii]|uniref:Transport permease protein n=2 Tax=Mycobacterium cookii TaxID=1775 RepID=A0A7I7KXV7_9MYCO|nr:ABC transporter [Mycobacterium cookii]